MMKPPRKPKPVWLFDLDNTLHDANAHIFPRMHTSMMHYICEHLAIDLAEATALRKTYWKKYGATLLGLMKHHRVDPHHFLHETHQFPEIDKLVCTAPGLRGFLKSLPGRKIIFSNAPRHYIKAVLRAAGIERSFDLIYSIESMRFRPKPAISSYRRLLHQERLKAKHCIMIEDTQKNLKTAKRLGMKTVWITPQPRALPYVDIKVPTVTRLRRCRI